MMRLSKLRFFLASLLLLLSSFSQPALAKAENLRFSEMYDGMTVRGIILSDKLKSLEGKQVRMTGFMAPPLTQQLIFL